MPVVYATPSIESRKRVRERICGIGGWCEGVGLGVGAVVSAAGSSFSAEGAEEEGVAAL